MKKSKFSVKLNSFSRDLRVLKKFREGKLFAKIGDLKSTIKVVDFNAVFVRGAVFNNISVDRSKIIENNQKKFISDNFF